MSRKHFTSSPSINWRIRGRTIGVLAALVAILAMTPASAQSLPQIQNPSFESSLGTEWTKWVGPGGNQDNNERQYASSGMPHGVWCLAVKGIGSGGKGAYQYVPNNWIDGHNYRFSVWVKNISNTNINYSVGYKLGNGGSDGTTATYGNTIIHPSTWTQATVEFTYAGSAGATVYLRAVNDGHMERAGFDLVEVADLGASGPTGTATHTPTTGPTSPPTPTYTPGAFTFSGFTYAQLLDHFQYYHERSECVYLGNGTWAALETNLSHPLARDSSRRALGYMRAHQVEAESRYEQLTGAALDWLVDEQNPDGHFTWWNTPGGTDNGFDCQYVTGTAASALAEGYVLFGGSDYLQASALAAQWEQNQELVWNTNYVLFAVWHLAKHYGITGEQQWLDAAVYKVQNCAFPRQDTDGGWNEGDGAPAEMIGHNKRIWYHGIILRGLCELYRVMPTDHPIRTQLRNSIQAGVDRALNMQLPSGEIEVGAGVPNEHRNAFIMEALLMAYEHVGIDTRDAVRGIMQYRMDFSQEPYQDKAFNIDVQSVGYLMQLYNAIVPDPPAEPTPTPLPAVPEIDNPDFEDDGEFFNLAQGWQTYGYGKREGFQEAGHGWVQGIADYPEAGFAGIYQFVGGVEPGAVYRFSVQVRTTSQQLAGSIGVAGIETHDRHSAAFSSEYNGSSWTSISVETTAVEPCVSLFLQGRNTNQYSISFERVLFDNVTMEQIGAPSTPTVTPTIDTSANPTPHVPSVPVYGLSLVLGESIEAPGWQHDDYGGDLDRIAEVYTEAETGCVLIGFSQWNLIEPNDPGSGPSTYDWTLVDASIDPFLHMLADHLTVTYASIVDVPDWMTYDYGTPEFWNLADRFLENFARYMNTKGIYYFVFENEPNMLARSDWADYYMERLQHAYAAIKQADSRNQVIAGNLSENAAASGHFNMLYDRGLKNYSDVIGHHPYSNDSATGVDLDDIKQLHQVMEQYGDGPKKIWLGEGWGPKRDVPGVSRDSAADRPNRAEIDRLREFMINGHERLSQSSYGYDPNWVLGSLFFTFNDNLGALHWAERATPVPGGCLIDGIFIEGCDTSPRHHNGGLIDLYGNAKGDIIWRFPDYTYRPSPTPKPNPPAVGPNLIVNGDFEGGFTGGVANGWQAFDTTATGIWEPRTGRTGGTAQAFGEDDVGFNGGIVQSFTTTPGEWYGIYAWISYDQVNNNDPNIFLAVGWDPTGQTSDPRAMSMVWSIDYAKIGLSAGEWHYVEHAFQAEESQGSVWFWGGQEWASPIFFMRVDDVQVLNVQNPDATPDPNATPTSTFTPTNTPPPASPTPPPQTTPVVVNPSFESSIGSEWLKWVGSGSNQDNNERQYEGGNARDGAWVLAVKGIGTGGKGAYQYIPDGWMVGHEYRLSVWTRNLSNTNMNYSIGYKLGSGGSDGASATYGNTVVHPSSWTQATVEFTYAGSAGATLYLRVVNDGHSERAGFDLAQITDLGPSGPLPTSTPTFTPTNTSQASPPTNTPEPDTTPVVLNPSFESSLGSEWQKWVGSGSNQDNNERDYLGASAPNGSWVLAVKGIGTGGKGAYQYIADGWIDGHDYRISVWVKNLSNTNINYSVGYKLGNGGSSGSTATYGSTVVHPSSWTQATVEFSYEGSSGATIYLRAVNDGHMERAGFDMVEITDLGPSGPMARIEDGVGKSPFRVSTNDAALDFSDLQTGLFASMDARKL